MTLLKTRCSHVKPLPALEYLRALFSYDPATGSLCWMPRRDKIGRLNTRYIGQEAGNIGRDGYRYVMIDEQNYGVHRVIWKWVTGRDPIDEIDHYDLCRSDNRWDNLREATHGENNHNVPCKSHSGSRVKGVYFAKRQRGSKKWRAQIRRDGKQYHLGYFETRDEAALAFATAAEKLYGEMARAA